MTTPTSSLASEAAAHVTAVSGVDRCDTWIVLGSGWSAAAEALGAPACEIQLADIPGFSKPSVAGHHGTLRVLTIAHRVVVLQLGRTHLYEDRGTAPVVHGVVVASALGASTIVLTNGCGGVHPHTPPGTPVLIKDHLNLTAVSPLSGPTFVDLTEVYSSHLRTLCHSVDPTLTEGVYAQFRGPQYETPAEVRMARALGADLVGMSTALEAIQARALGMEVLGISLVTNLAAGVSPTPLHHEEVLQAGLAAAIGHWLETNNISGPVVIGYDARRLGSHAAQHAAAVLSDLGRAVLVAPHPVPTPLIAFATRELPAACGIMITASHNPATDNGVKVFNHDGRQIIEPGDTDIQHLMATLPPPTPTSPAPPPEIPHHVFSSYVNSVLQLSHYSTPAQRAELRVAHTSLHGVAHRTVSAVLATLGIDAVFTQSTPDPSFPGLPFPNPEEPGVMNDVIALAELEHCALAVANDPDADRLAVAVRTKDGFRTLTGDELGAVLLWWKLTNTDQAELCNTHTASTIVSSQLPAAISEMFGAHHHVTLTGFKWLSRVPGVAFAYEEALGYCVDPQNVRDKDGISALAMLCDMVAAGHDPVKVLDHLAAALGHYTQHNLSLRIAAERSAKLHAALLNLSRLGPLEVKSVLDLSTSSTPTTGLKLHLEHPNSAALRLVLRPSGTEPKTKAYIEATHHTRELAIAAGQATAVALLELTELLA